MDLYVGSFQYGGGEGITRVEFDAGTGTFGACFTEDEKLNAGNLLQAGNLLYATDEKDAWDGKPGGRIRTFRIDPGSGALQPAADTRTLGVNPAGLCLSPSGRQLMVSHFSAGAAVVKTVVTEDGFEARAEFHDTVTTLLALGEDGVPGAVLDVYVHPVREGVANTLVHQMFRMPGTGQYAYCNLGLDAIWFLQLTDGETKITAKKVWDCPFGSGPRHLIFHPSGRRLYCNYERYPYISQFACTKEGLAHVADYDVLDEEDPFTPASNQSEILMNAAGDRLYNVMRGAGTLSVFAADHETGALTLLQQVRLKGKMTRCAAFAPDGRYLVVSETDAQVLESFLVCPDGTLQRIDISGHVPHPAGLAFYERQEERE